MMLHDLVRDQAEKNPDNISVTQKNRHLPYGQLESESNRLAALLRHSGVEAGDRVGLLMERSPEMIVALHGVSKAGAISVPLDTIYSASDLDRYLRLAGISLIMVDITRFRTYRNWNTLHGSSYSLSWCWWSTEALPEAELRDPCLTMTDIDDQENFPLNPAQYEHQTTPAMILFQPNRYGFPSPLVVTHKEIVTFATWSSGYFGMRTEDRIAGSSPLSEVLSLLDLFGTFAAGSHLYLPSGERKEDEELSEFILENDITQWSSTPSYFHALATENAVKRTGYPGLERMIWWGDQVLEPVLHYWMHQLPNTGFTRLYSIDKSGLATSYHTIHALPGERRAGDAVRSGRIDTENDMTHLPHHGHHLSPQQRDEESCGSEFWEEVLDSDILSGLGSSIGSASQNSVGDCLAVGPDGSLRHQKIVQSGPIRFLFEQGNISVHP